MEAVALQNVWIDKSLYDEAECNFHKKSLQGGKCASKSIPNNVWTDKSLYDEAECSYYEKLSKLPEPPKGSDPKPLNPNPAEPAPEGSVQKSSKKNKKAKKHNKSKSISETSENIVENISETEEPKIEQVQVQEKPDKGNKNKESKKKRRESEKDKDDKGDSSQVICSQSSLASEVAKARQHIKNSLECMDTVLSSVNNSTVLNMSTLTSTIMEMKNMIYNFQSEIDQLKQQVAALTLSVGGK